MLGYADAVMEVYDNDVVVQGFANLEGKFCDVAQFVRIDVEGQSKVTVLHCVTDLHHRPGHHLMAWMEKDRKTSKVVHEWHTA